MLYMTVVTWEPDKRNEVIQRALEREEEETEGVEVIGWWNDLMGGRSFTVVETDDPGAVMQVVQAWSDIVKFETTPVIERDEVMKILKGQ